MELIHYGKKHFDAKLFKPIRNRLYFPKPEGGLWASPVNSEYGWREWCESEQFAIDKLTTHFTFRINGNILVIDKLIDLVKVPFVDNVVLYPDFQSMLASGIDAIHLTVNGLAETRFSEPNLYGWDCESVLVMNPAIIRAE